MNGSRLKRQSITELIEEECLSVLWRNHNEDLKVGDFVHHKADAKTERTKMLVVEDLGNDRVCCRYIHYKDLHTNPHRKFHISELILVNSLALQSSGIEQAKSTSNIGVLQTPGKQEISDMDATHPKLDTPDTSKSSATTPLCFGKPNSDSSHDTSGKETTTLPDSQSLVKDAACNILSISIKKNGQLEDNYQKQAKK